MRLFPVAASSIKIIKSTRESKALLQILKQDRADDTMGMKSLGFLLKGGRQEEEVCGSSLIRTWWGRRR